MTPARLRRFSSRASSSCETLGSGMPASEASRSTASGNERPSVSIRKSKIEPFLPEEKSNHACFWSFTKKDGVFSLLKGESPFHSRPALRSFTRRPTTSETGSRARSSSRNWGVKRIRDLGLESLDRILARWPTGHGYREGGLKYEENWASRRYSQGLLRHSGTRTAWTRNPWI